MYLMKEKTNVKEMLVAKNLKHNLKICHLVSRGRPDDESFASRMVDALSHADATLTRAWDPPSLANNGLCVRGRIQVPHIKPVVTASCDISSAASSVIVP